MNKLNKILKRTKLSIKKHLKKLNFSILGALCLILATSYIDDVYEKTRAQKQEINETITFLKVIKTDLTVFLESNKEISNDAKSISFLFESDLYGNYFKINQSKIANFNEGLHTKLVITHHTLSSLLKVIEESNAIRKQLGQYAIKPQGADLNLILNQYKNFDYSIKTGFNKLTKEVNEVAKLIDLEIAKQEEDLENTTILTNLLF